MMLLWQKRNREKRHLNILCEILLGLSIFLFGLSYTQIRTGQTLPYSGQAHIDGWASSIFKTNDYATHIIIEADTISTKDCKFNNVRGYLKIYDTNIDIKPGEYISANTWIKQVKTDIIAPIDEQMWMNEHNFQFIASTDSIIQHGRTQQSISTHIWQLRQLVRYRLTSSGMSVDNINVMMALLMGDRSQLDNATKQQFSDCGIIHILAVSGMHVALIYSIISIMLANLRRRNRTLSCLVLLTTLWTYAIICGMSPSVFRAVIMMSIVEIGRVKGRTPDLNNTLCVAALIILVVSPTDIYNLGFWLSFSAVWGLANLCHCFNGHNPMQHNYIGRYVYNSGTMSLVAQISTAPISLMAFHRFPVYFLIHNILLIWLIAPLVLLTLASALDGGILQIGIVTDMVLNGFRGYIAWVSKWPFAVIENIHFSTLQCILALITLYALSWAVSNKWFSWQISKIWLTVGVCASAFIATSIVEDIKTSQREIYIAYKAGKESGLSIITGKYCTHILSDTANTQLLRKAYNIEQKMQISQQQTKLMYEDMLITTPTDTLLIIGNNTPNQLAPTAIIVGNATPTNTTYKNIICANTLFADEWAKQAEIQFNNLQLTDIAYIEK